MAQFVDVTRKTFLFLFCDFLKATHTLRWNVEIYYFPPNRQIVLKIILYNNFQKKELLEYNLLWHSVEISCNRADSFL